MIVGISLVLYVYKTISDVQVQMVDITKEKRPPTASEVYDVEGNLISTVFLQERYYKPLSEISIEFQNTIISAEDERFYMHKGFDIRGLLRVFWHVLTRPGRPPGASTITQQLARSELYLNQSQREIKRKITEIYLAYQLEQRYTKEQILEEYVNQVPFSLNTYGVEAAARKYFGKNAKDLDYAESAMICGSLPAPSIYNPKTNPEKAKKSQLNVLRKLEANGFITEEERKQYEEQELVYKKYSDIEYRDNINFFVDYVVKYELPTLIDDPTIIEEGGLKIYTTLNMNYHKHAEKSIQDFYASMYKSGSFRKDIVSKDGATQPQSALVSTNPKTGAILAMMGGVNYNESEFPRAVSRQPPGSSFKVFDYTCAIENRSLTGGSLLMSDDFEIEGYTPGEWNRGTGRFDEELVRQALIDSSNICALRAALRPGLYNVAYYANKMGITTEVKPYYSMPIGSMEVKPVDMACAYGCLATNGMRIDPYAIQTIETPDGREIYRHEIHPVRVVSEEVSWIMTNLLRSVHIAKGKPGLGFNVAGKTGTAGDDVAGWYCCYSPDIVTVVYTGVDDKDYTNVFRYTPWGSSVAFPIAYNYLAMCAKDEKYPVPKNKFPEKPEGVVAATVCKYSGHLVTEYCPEEHRATEYFLEGTVPTRYCQYHAEPRRLFMVYEDKDTGEYFRTDNRWVNKVEVMMTQREYDSLEYHDGLGATPLIDDIVWSQPEVDGSPTLNNDSLIFETIDGVILAKFCFRIPKEKIDLISSVTLTMGDREIYKWKIGKYEIDLGRGLTKEDLTSGICYEDVRYKVPPEGDQSEVEILIELNGPGNFYSNLEYEATIVNP